MKKIFYRVLKNDGVLSIANKFNMPVSLLIAKNNLKKEVEAGDMLYIESEKDALYTVKPSDTLSSLSEKFNVSQSQILLENGLPYLFYGLKIKI